MHSIDFLRSHFLSVVSMRAYAPRAGTARFSILASTPLTLWFEIAE